MTRFEVGQQVFARKANRYGIQEDTRLIPGVVEKVGRKYVYVKLENSWNVMKFELEPPRREVSDMGYSPDYILHTTQDAAENFWFAHNTSCRIAKQADRIRNVLDKLPDEEMYGYSRQLDRILDLLEELDLTAKEYGL